MNKVNTPFSKLLKTSGLTTRQYLIVMLVSLVFFVFGLTAFTLSEDFLTNKEYIQVLLTGNIKYIIAFSGLTAVAGILISYVNKGIGGTRSNTEVFIENSRIKNELTRLKSQVEELAQRGSNEIQKVDLEPIERAELIASAKKRIIGNTLLAADVSLKNDINSLRHQVDINKHYSDIVYRLENEIDRLNRRGGVNLVIGAIIAVVGIVYLGFTVANQLETNDKLGYILHMAPRLSFVIIIELFAYFFLKLYKNGFEEVKYFQNELTNIDSKVLGIKFLKDVRNEELMGEVIRNLMATERNFILEKGQSTVSLEQQRLRNDEGKNVAEVLKEITKIRK
ncbi:hypothetical protein [Enterobacter cloacae]|uniref:hypothetical protein n=1 Tax=Enterobacter cloacae TaxID=550 RepID=UPI002006BBA9|nr:hypothetical protein [Enterobacter cloacae]MCK7339739.1 hypothetical protein [Enterobacter cloacae]